MAANAVMQVMAGPATAKVVETIAGPVTPDVSWMAYLPLLAVIVPWIGAVITALVARKVNETDNKIRHVLTCITAISAFVIVVLMQKPVVQGIEVGGQLYKGLELHLPLVLGKGITFGVAPIGLLIATVTSLIWALSSIYATSYMTIEHAPRRYFLFVILTLGANLGVLLSKDLFTLFLFFEMMAVLSLTLVVHNENGPAMAAGKVFNYMGTIGGLLLLGGMMILYSKTGTLDIAPMTDLIEATMPGALKYVVAALMILGFGSKAGIFYMHIWLPEAHPVAPTPASALLSGLMIKTGAYGILTTVCMLFAPDPHHAAHGMTTLNYIGYAVIWVGIGTMFFGVVNALLSTNCKRMLAYHSVSQMGYIVMGVGVAGYLGNEGAMGLAGSAYHMVNHALFKAGLFFSVGAVYFHTHELDMYKLGGMIRNMPFTAVACLVSVFGITAMPMFNGYASKTLLHHAIEEAYTHSAHFTASHQPDTLLLIAEAIFVLTAFGTFCSNAKMWSFVFIWKRPEKYKDVPPEPMSMRIAMGILSAVIIFVGLKPHFLINHYIGPALGSYGMDPASYAYSKIYYLGYMTSKIHLLYDPLTMEVLTKYNVGDFLGVGIATLGGGLYFILGYRFGWFHAAPPEWTSVKYQYTKFATKFIDTLSAVSIAVSDGVNKFYYDATAILNPISSISLGTSETVNNSYYAIAPKFIRFITGASSVTSEAVDGAYARAGDVVMKAAEGTTHFDRAIDRSYDRSGELVRGAAARTQAFDRSIDSSYERSGELVKKVAMETDRFDRHLDESYEKSGELVKRVAMETDRFDRQLDEAYEEAPKKSLTFWDKFLGRQEGGEFDIKSLGFDTLLMAIVLGVFLFVLIYYTHF